MKQTETFDRLDYTYKLLVIIALVITASLLASDIVVPILISAILAIVLLPVVKRFEKKNVSYAFHYFGINWFILVFYNGGRAHHQSSKRFGK
jgi:predicted PurR-regulated permease PerM